MTVRSYLTPRAPYELRMYQPQYGHWIKTGALRWFDSPEDAIAWVRIKAPRDAYTAKVFEIATERCVAEATGLGLGGKPSYTIRGRNVA